MSMSRLRAIAIAFASTALVACATPAFDSEPAPGPDPAPGGETGTEPAASPGSGGVASRAAAADSYRLGQGDRIAIQVFDEPDLTMEATVSGSGVINYSYLGNLQVAGRTPAELERTIADTLREGYLVNPSVNVSIVEFRPFFINGEVRSPGSYPYQPGLTLNKAIALAGGLSDRASQRRMFVVRARGDTQERQRIGGGAPINPGDTISIEEGFF